MYHQVLILTYDLYAAGVMDIDVLVAGCSMSLSLEGDAPALLCVLYLLLFFSVITFVQNAALCSLCDEEDAFIFLTALPPKPRRTESSALSRSEAENLNLTTGLLSNSITASKGDRRMCN